MLTDRDIVVKVLAEGKNPSEVTAVSCEGKPVTIELTTRWTRRSGRWVSTEIRRLP